MPVLVTNDFPPQHGGIQRFMSRVAHELALCGECVTVVAPQVAESRRFDFGQRFRVLRYPDRGRVIGFIGMTVMFGYARLAARDSRTIASIWFPSGLAACLIPRFARGRLGVLAHGAEIAPSKGGVRRRLMRYVFERADVVVANSTFTRDLLVAAGVRGCVYVVNPGIDSAPIEPARSTLPTILSVGRLIARKGFDTVIEALPAILREHPHARYEIVGSGPQRADLEALARRLGVADRVAFLGALDDEEVRAAYARAWIFALPVRAVGNDVEGFGMVYLEAALAALPAIGGLCSGARDAIVPGETGLLVDGNSSGEVSAAVIELFANRAGADEMGLRGRARALEFFTWKRAAAELAALMA